MTKAALETGDAKIVFRLIKGKIRLTMLNKQSGDVLVCNVSDDDLAVLSDHAAVVVSDYRDGA